ncbi:Mediator complex subunit Med4 [Penicillium malachiteum]|uniref:Mediator of RNA polymerase II transcription subunit 4 n=1 Tax=Penicillium malachiteum TaxID=1324776 RepID=A0AAD6MZ33_9EURO|nr:Mediator complex subunit Med4 [Penicillium malachiteum]
MNTVMQSSLSEVEAKVNALLTTLTTSPTAAGAPAAAIALLNADDNLSSSLRTLRRHQENYTKILQLRAETQRLEDRVKSVVRDVEFFDKEIRTACGDDEESDSDLDSNDEDETGRKSSRKEIDYRLLLDFARRISKYNHEAAADAANGAFASGKQPGSRLQIPDKDMTMTGTGTNGDPTTEQGAEPVSSVTKTATQWLDDSANVTREIYMLPYPMEERIRMGLMGQVQLAAGNDPDKEVERLIREAEGLGVAEPPAPPPPVDSRQEEAANAAAQAASAATGVVRPPAPVAAPAPKPKPKVSLDLDLYDPDDDDF